MSDRTGKKAFKPYEIVPGCPGIGRTGTGRPGTGTGQPGTSTGQPGSRGPSTNS